ncbi:hypothetical protein [Clostridium minihomine]|uniref:hypothetical protein n=1 Tax=Clostridium minihomine TaxID=2045012 RepID=UPI000C77CCA3|nr:hypothetical protein [Clostridium minihomine]
MANALALIPVASRSISIMTKLNSATAGYQSKTILAQQAAFRFSMSLQGMGNSAQKSQNALDKAKEKVKELVKSLELGKKALNGFKDAFQLAQTMEWKEKTFQSMTGSKESGTALMEYAKLYGQNKSILGAEGTVNATEAFLPYTTDLDEIQKLYQLTERLYAKNPGKGIDGAVNTMSSILAGDVSAAKGQYGITELSGDNMQTFAGNQDMQGTIGYLDDTFNRFGATQDLVTGNFTSLIIQAEMFGNKIQAALADQAGPIIQNLSYLFQQLNEAMDAGKFTPFFELIGLGCEMVGSMIGWIADNLDWLIPTIAGVASAFLIMVKVMKVVRAAIEIVHLTLTAMTGNWLGLIAAIIGVAVGVGVSNKMKEEMDKLEDLEKNLEDQKKIYNENKKEPTEDKKESLVDKINTNRPLPVELSNTAPISVKGEVEIEKESQRYLFDLAAQKAFATFNMQQVVPQVIIQNQNVSQSADLEEISRGLGDLVFQNQQVQAAGVYG